MAVLLIALTGTSCTGVIARNSQFYLPGDYNFAFYNTHRRAAQSFYAAHVAHFGIYQVALTQGEDATDSFVELENRIRRFVMTPPRFEPPAEVIAPSWMRMAHATGRAMDWTHYLHSQLYDILTDPSVTEKQAAGERAIAYYLSTADAAFSTRGYGHRWMMGGGTWAGVFARKYPDINGILWAYHWHHAAVYEALMEPTAGGQTRELDRVLDLFVDSVLANPPEYMPLTAEVVPRFSRMFPAAAHIFDNLHMMHDITNDIMVDENLSRKQKETEIDRMLRNQIYATQDSTVAPSSMRIPTARRDGFYGTAHDALAARGDWKMSTPSWVRVLPLFAVAIVAILWGREAIAQEDFLSLDAGRPLKVTDAYPKKYLEWEFQFGLQGGWTEGGRRSLEGLLELETGLFRNSRSVQVCRWPRRTMERAPQPDSTRWKSRPSTTLSTRGGRGPHSPSRPVHWLPREAIFPETIGPWGSI